MYAAARYWIASECFRAKRQKNSSERMSAAAQ